MLASRSEQESCGSRGREPLPEWLLCGSPYEPSTDRDSFMRRNVLALTRALVTLRAEPDPAERRTGVDRALGGVAPTIRLVGTLVLVACVSLARNLAFAWLMLVILLVLCAAVRMTTKTFVTVGYVAGLAQTLGSDGMVAALRGLGLAPQVATVADLALRDIVVLGESATSLSEALSLRSVGTNKDKTASAAGVMGAVFVRAQRLATARAEAMELRGYGLGWADARMRRRLRGADVAYVLAMAAVVAAFVCLEGAMA